MFDWGSLLLPAGVLLVVPVAIVLGHRRSTGSIIVCAALTAADFAAFWLLFGGVSSLYYQRVGSGFPFGIVALYSGLVLAFATWALALNAAAQARRWGWVALVFVAGYLTFAAVIFSTSAIATQVCIVGVDGTITCPDSNPVRQALTLLGYLACPVAALVYGIRAPGRRERQAPEGLVISSLRAKRQAEVAAPAVADEGGE